MRRTIKYWTTLLLILLSVWINCCTASRKLQSPEDEKMKQALAGSERLTNELKRDTQRRWDQHKERMRQEWGTDDPLRVAFLKEEKKQNGLSHIKIGIRDSMVKELCGAPNIINQTIMSSHIHEQWIYIIYPSFIVDHRLSDPNIVLFDKRFSENIYLYFEDGILIGIQKGK